MQCAIHISAMDDILSNRPNEIISSYLKSSLIGVTRQVLTDYDTNLRTNPYYFPWFTANPRFKNLDHLTRTYAFPELDTINNDYLAAAFFTGCNLITSSHDFSDSDVSSLGGWGIQTLDVVGISHSHFVGDNPVLHIRLMQNSNFDPSCLTPFTCNENYVVFFDKFINIRALKTICSLCDKLDDQSEITIVTSTNGRGCCSSTAIIDEITAVRPRSSINVKIATQRTCEILHDRYMFVGKRFQIKLTRGFDAFYKTAAGEWRNRVSDVYVENVVNCTSSLDLHTTDGDIINVPMCI